MSDEAPPGISVEQLYAHTGVADEELDELLDRSLGPRSPDMLYDLVAAMGLGPRDRLLDVGSSDGRRTFALAARVDVPITALELVWANLARRHGVEVAPDVAARVRFVQGTIERLPFPDGTFSVVWARDMLVHVPDLAGALRECRRVLSPGGRMVIFNMFATPWLEPKEAGRLWPALAVVPENTDPESFERAVAGAGFRIELVDPLGSEWREHGEEQGDRRTSRQLLHVARMLRDPDRYLAALGGRSEYAAELSDALWGVYQMIGKLSPRVYVLRSE